MPSRRRLGLLAAATALAVPLSLAVAVSPGAAAAPGTPDPAALSSAGTGPDRSTTPELGAAPRAGDHAISAPWHGSATAPRTAARKGGWPVGFRYLTMTGHSVTPSGDASQTLTRVFMKQTRWQRSVRADVRLAAAPTPATDAAITIAFGYLSADRTRCNSPAYDNWSFHSYGTEAGYRGARIVLTPFRAKHAGGATWNCAFAQVRSFDGASFYDEVAGSPKTRIQKPDLHIKVKGRKLDRRGFTRVPVIISNSRRTVAGAPAVRLRWRTTGVRVKANPKVGGIKPGGSKRGAIYVKDVGRPTGSIKLIVRSRNYQRAVTLRVHRL